MAQLILDGLSFCILSFIHGSEVSECYLVFGGYGHGRHGMQKARTFIVHFSELIWTSIKGPRTIAGPYTILVVLVRPQSKHWIRWDRKDRRHWPPSLIDHGHENDQMPFENSFSMQVSTASQPKTYLSTIKTTLYLVWVTSTSFSILFALKWFYKPSFMLSVQHSYESDGY